MSKLIGTNPNQVPTNADLGTMAYLDAETEIPRLIGGRRNLIINGDMRVAQRGTSFSPTATVYTLDRWQGYWGAITGSTITQSTDVPSDQPFKNSMKVTLAALTSGWPILRQRIEDFNSIIGTTAKQDVTLSFWAKASVAMSVKADLGDNETSGITANLTTEWQRFSVTYPKGSAFTYDAVDIQNNSSGGDLYITGVQLELGSVATPFEHRSYGEELALCQRYYWKSDINNSYYSMVLRPDWIRVFHIQFPTTMRAAPTATYTYNDDGSGVSMNVALTCASYFRASTLAVTASNRDPRLDAFAVDAEL